MTQSMTGFGAAEGTAEGLHVRVEIKSLNSKGFEVNFRLPRAYFEQELVLKSLLQDRLGRGKVSCSVAVTHRGDTPALGPLIDTELLEAYYHQLRSVQQRLAHDTPPSLTALLNLPGVVQEPETTVSDAEWALVQAVTEKALAALVASRTHEGNTLGADLEARVRAIQALAEETTPLDAQRAELTRARLQQQLAASGFGLVADDPRFAQEVVYYLERLDITEERVRLAAHLTLFLDTLAAPESQGRKLGFIAQEMGREINTLGAKANHSGLQALVVTMKDELEKIKEQLGNIL